MGTQQEPNRKREGVILIWIAVLAMVLVGISGLAVDAAHMYFVGHQLQVTADAAARAGAYIVHRDPADVQAFVREVVAENTALGEELQLADEDIEIGLYTPSDVPGEVGTFTVTGESPNAVRVTARRTEGSLSGPVPTYFGRIFFVDTLNVSRFAIAQQSGGAGAGLIVLHSDTPCALHMDSNARIRVGNGAVQVNSSATNGLCMDSNSEIDSGAVNVSGGARMRGNARMTGTLNEGVSPLDDPLADLPVPSTGTDRGSVRLDSNSRRTIEPGYYSGGIKLDSNSSLYLNPGVYVLDGVGLVLRSNTSIRGEGVSIYVKNDINAGSRTYVRSNGWMDLTPPSTGPYKDVVLWQSRANTNDMVINSNGHMNVEGAVYLPNPNSTAHLNSNGDVFGNTVLAHRVHLDSNAEVVVEGGVLFGNPRGAYLVR